MKYFVFLVIALGAYYYYQKSNLYTHENVVKIVLNKQGEMCSNNDMLKDQGITAEGCNKIFAKNIGSCVASMNSKYNGDKFSSKEEAEKAISELANCLTGWHKKGDGGI